MNDTVLQEAYLHAAFREFAEAVPDDNDYAEFMLAILYPKVAVPA